MVQRNASSKSHTMYDSMPSCNADSATASNRRLLQIPWAISPINLQQEDIWWFILKSMFTCYLNDYIYILLCQPVGRPVNLYILYSNFTCISIFCSLFSDFTQILCVNHYVDQSTRICYSIISYIHQLLLVFSYVFIYADWSMSTRSTG